MRNIPIKFRWPLKQTGPKEIVIEVPTGPNGAPILSMEFIKQEQLTDREIDVAENQVLRAIAIIE